MSKLKTFRASLDKSTESEFEQTLVRFALAAFVVFYCNILMLQDAGIRQLVYIVAHIYFAISFLLILSVLFYPSPSALRRIGGTVTDVITVTIGMTFSSYYTSLFWGGYLWISIGNGLRYGNRYLFGTVAASVLCFGFVLFTTEYWLQNLPLGSGLLLWMLLIPLYVSMLIKRLERAMIAAKDASQTKSRFLASMSHELRTPLNAIIGYTEILLEDVDERNGKTEAEDLKKVKNSATHLLSLINELLDISKIEAGKMDVYFESVDLPALIGEVASAVQPLVEANKNILRIEIADNVVTVITDVVKMRQILFNLLSNASKFTNEGDISIYVTTVIKGSGQWLKLVIKDTGIGITQEQLSKLFQAFVQADESTARNYGGTGLGLVLCRQFTEMMGGHIDAYSEQDRGSTFIVMLPMNPPQSTHARN